MWCKKCTVIENCPWESLICRAHSVCVSLLPNMVIPSSLFILFFIIVVWIFPLTYFYEFILIFVGGILQALGLAGQKLLGVPIIVQHTQAEKNRAGNSMPNMVIPKGNSGPMRLYVGSLHFNITEDMLRGIFEPFGKIDNIQLIMDPETGRSKGYGFLTVS